jgi:hypothetical protein
MVIGVPSWVVPTSTTGSAAMSLAPIGWSSRFQARTFGLLLTRDFFQALVGDLLGIEQKLKCSGELFARILTALAYQIQKELMKLRSQFNIHGEGIDFTH